MHRRPPPRQQRQTRLGEDAADLLESIVRVAWVAEGPKDGTSMARMKDRVDHTTGPASRRYTRTSLVLGDR